MEYFTVSMLDYFEDTLSNMGLPEAWLECDSNDTTKIGKKYVKCKSNQIKKHWVKLNWKL